MSDKPLDTDKEIDDALANGIDAYIHGNRTEAIRDLKNLLIRGKIEERKRVTKRLVTEMQLDMRLKFDARKQDFQTFDAMLTYMNGWVADELSKELEQQLTKEE